MQRKEWIFEYRASKVAEAAAIRREHHKQRLAWWSEQKNAVMAEVKDSGIEVSESPSASYGNTHMDRAPQVMVRNDLQIKLTECHSRIKAHDTWVREYAGWYQVLSANPEALLKLHYDDWLYFFGR